MIGFQVYQTCPKQVSPHKRVLRNLEKECTPVFFKIPLGSWVTIQPSRQPGAHHLFDIEPSVITGTTEQNIAIGTNGVLPKVRRS